MTDLENWQPELTFCPECGTPLVLEPHTARKDAAPYCPKCEVAVEVLPGAPPIGH